jgi:hypothetical protein
VYQFINTITYNFVSLVLFSKSKDTIMPRKSPYYIRLTLEDRNILEAKTKKYTLPYFEVLRAQMILLAADGWDNKRIAEHLNTRREVVSLWRKRFYEKGLAGLEEGARSGRPRAFSPSRDHGNQSPGV